MLYCLNNNRYITKPNPKPNPNPNQTKTLTLSMVGSCIRYFWIIDHWIMDHGIDIPKSKCIPNFGEISQSRLKYYYFRFLKTNVRHVGIYFRFRFLRLRHHRHLPTKFRPNRTIGDRVMASYLFFRMAVTASQFYFRFRFSWVALIWEVEIYLHAKFRRDISIHGWAIITSGFWKQTSAML